MIAVHGANHAFSAESARIVLLQEIEGFLDKNIGATAPPGAP